MFPAHDLPNSEQSPARRDEAFPVPKSRVRDHCQVLVVCGLLMFAVGLVFAQTVHYEFVNYDDGVYVYDNPAVAGGLSAHGIAWAFTRLHAGYWIPLTWISLMIDCQLYGLQSGGCHLTNVVLHAVTAVLLFFVLWRMTGRLWPGAGGASLPYIRSA